MILDLKILWIILAVILLIMVSSLIACLCGCCRKTPRDELMGISGKVKITNPDVSQNNNAPLALSITRTASDDNVPLSVPLSNFSSKRTTCTGINNCHPGTATRSLPEIPVDAIKSGLVVEGVPETSNFVEYIPTDTSSDLYATLEEHKISSGVVKSKLSSNVFGSSSQSNAAVTYEQIDGDTTYNKIKEHPYAQVENTDDGNVASTSRIERDSPDSSSPQEESNVVNIPAASAITGNIAASNELPYMTPPLHTNFSGDSQDSTKGYTSITVREPLARIRPQNKLTDQHVSDSHYTVLSDDSDEMYAAIQDSYTSGSETYAQIQPVAPTSHPSTSAASITQKFSQVSIHSRQASTSSIASCLTNRNSPKEKRQANSPLPKPPDIMPDDMYAKVLKKRKYESDWCSSKDSVFSVDHDSASASASSISFHSGPVNVDQKNNEENEKKEINDDVDEVDGIGLNGCYETLPERNYEMLSEVNHCPGYETVKDAQNYGYESLPELDSLTPGYERIRDPVGPGYEKVKYKAVEEDISEPNYEELKPRKEQNSFHCYATIDKKKTMSSGDLPEPDYASLTRHRETEYDSWNNGDPFYERIRKRCDDDEDLEDADESEKDTKYNDKNNNHSNTAPKNERLARNHSVSENNLSDLYSKVNKKKR